MELLWVRLGQAFGASIRDTRYGPVDGKTFAEWSRRLEQYTGDQIARGVGNCQQWHEAEAPTLNEFCGLCLTDRGQAQAAPPAPPKDHSVRDREMERQRRILSGSKARIQTPDDVETFMEAYHNCGCGRRWPGGQVVI